MLFCKTVTSPVRLSYKKIKNKIINIIIIIINIIIINIIIIIITIVQTHSISLYDSSCVINCHQLTNDSISLISKIFT